MKESIPLFKKPSHEKNPEEEWLEEQFKKVDTLDIEGTPVRVLDISPREMKDEVPVALAGGYGTSSPLHNKVNILEMVRQGRRTLFVDEPRGIDFAREEKHSVEPEPAEKEKEIEEFFLRQTEALIAVLDKKEIGKTDAVGHSEGCMYLAVAASQYPERFRDLVLFNPAGMIGDDTFVKLCYRFLTEGLNEIKRKKEEMSPAARQQAKEGGEGFKKYLKEDPAASIEEVRSMAKQQIRDLLKQAHERGVKISIVHSANDKVLPMIRVQKETARTPEEKEWGDELIVDGFYSVRGGHGEFVFDPERFTRVADEALTALEKRREKEESM